MLPQMRSFHARRCPDVSNTRRLCFAELKGLGSQHSAACNRDQMRAISTPSLCTDSELASGLLLRHSNQPSWFMRREANLSFVGETSDGFIHSFCPQHIQGRHQAPSKRAEESTWQSKKHYNITKLNCIPQRN